MDGNNFKKILQKCMDRVGFSFKNNNYYYDNNEMIAVINVQKSNYDNSVYINYGFYLKDIHTNTKPPKINECDIFGRFINCIDGNKKTDFSLEELDCDKLEECIKLNIEKTIVPVTRDGIKKYFDIYPRAIMTAKRSLKEYLGFV